MILADIGLPEIAIVVGAVVLLFGASAVPKMARSLGQAKKEFEKGVAEGSKGEEADDKKA